MNVRCACGLVGSAVDLPTDKRPKGPADCLYDTRDFWDEHDRTFRAALTKARAEYERRNSYDTGRNGKRMAPISEDLDGLLDFIEQRQTGNRLFTEGANEEGNAIV